MSFDDLPPEVLWHIIEKSNYQCANTILRLNKNFHTIVTENETQFQKVKMWYFTIAFGVLAHFYDYIIKHFVSPNDEKNNEVESSIRYNPQSKKVYMGVTKRVIFDPPDGQNQEQYRLMAMSTMHGSSAYLKEFTLTYLNEFGWPANNAFTPIINHMKTFTLLNSQNKFYTTEDDTENFDLLIHDTLEIIDGLTEKTDSESGSVYWWKYGAATAVVGAAVLATYVLGQHWG